MVTLENFDGVESKLRGVIRIVPFSVKKWNFFFAGFIHRLSYCHRDRQLCNLAVEKESFEVGSNNREALRFKQPVVMD